MKRKTLREKILKKSVVIPTAIALTLVLAGVSVYAANTGWSGNLSQQSLPQVDITKAEAEEIALGEVSGATSGDITKSEMDYDDGVGEYDIEIIYDGCEYDFEISAADGSIITRSAENIYSDTDVTTNAGTGSDANSNTNANDTVTTHENEYHEGHADAVSSDNTASSDGISLKKAKSIALADVSGATSSNIVKAYEDYDDGIYTYDIEIHYNGYEYEYEIAKTSGDIIDKDIDYID